MCCLSLTTAIANSGLYRLTCSSRSARTLEILRDFVVAGNRRIVHHLFSILVLMGQPERTLMCLLIFANGYVNRLSLSQCDPAMVSTIPRSAYVP